MDNLNFELREVESKKPDENIRKDEICSFEETVSKLGTGTFHIFIMFVCGTALLSSVNESLVIGFVLPYTKCDIEISTTEQGILNSVGFLGIVLSLHAWGFLADTWGRKKVMQVSLFTTFTFSSLSSLSAEVWTLIALRFLVGLCVSGVQTSGIAYLGEFHSNKTRSKHVTFTAMFMTLSVVYMTSIGWAVIPSTWTLTLLGFAYRPWRLFIFLSSSINLAAFCGLLMMPESPKFMLAMGKRTEALDIIKRVYQFNTGNPKNSFPVKEIELEKLGSNLADAHGVKAVIKMMWTQTKPLFLHPHLTNVARMSYLAFCLYGVANGFNMWYPMILSMYYNNMDTPISICRSIHLNMDAKNISISNSEHFAEDVDECFVETNETTFQIYLVMGLFFIAKYCFVAMNMERIGRRLLLSIWLFIIFISGIGLIWAENFYLIQALAILLVSSGNLGTILTAMSADLFPTHYKAMALCLIMIAARIGCVVANNLVATQLYTTCDNIFYVFGGVLLSCGFVFLTVPTNSNST